MELSRLYRRFRIIYIRFGPILDEIREGTKIKRLAKSKIQKVKGRVSDSINIYANDLFFLYKVFI